MQLINNLEKIIVKSPGGELSSAFETSKDPRGGGGHSLIKNRGGLARYFGVLQTY